MLIDHLVCPKCNSANIQAPAAGMLVCSACQWKATKSAVDSFYDFRMSDNENSTHPTDEKSLLENQDQDFYPSDVFKNFVLKSSERQIDEALRVYSPSVVLDLGCGSGANAAQVLKNTQSYIGIDPSDIPSSIALKNDDPSRILLIHNNPEKDLPIKSESIDMLMFLASYDHIPNREPVIREAYRVLKPNGFMFVYMTNYAFWLKRLVNFVTGKRLFLNEHEHFCVHDPETLKAEVFSAEKNFEVDLISSADRMLPNLPQKFSFLYQSLFFIRIMNRVARFLIKDLLRVKHAGADMLVVFRKV